MKLFIYFILFFDFLNLNELTTCFDSCYGNNSSFRSCGCHMCDRFDDCCIDEQKLIKDKNYECEIQVSNNRYIYSISKCPRNFTDIQIKRKCEINDNSEILNLIYERLYLEFSYYCLQV